MSRPFSCVWRCGAARVLRAPGPVAVCCDQGARPRQARPSRVGARDFASEQFGAACGVSAREVPAPSRRVALWGGSPCGVHADVPHRGRRGYFAYRARSQHVATRGHGRDKRGPPVWGRAISLRNSSGRHAACRRAKYPRRPGAWRCGAALRAGYTPMSHAVGGAGTSRTGASSIGNSSSSSNFTIFHLDETAGLVIRLNRRREMFRFLGGAERKAYGAGPERGGTVMQQEGNVSSGKAGRQGGADGLDRVVEADNGNGTPRRSVRRGRMAPTPPSPGPPSARMCPGPPVLPDGESQ